MTSNPLWPVIIKAGEGNRTLTTSLEGWSSTIELRPQAEKNLLSLLFTLYLITLNRSIQNGGNRIRTCEGYATRFTVWPV